MTLYNMISEGSDNINEIKRMVNRLSEFILPGDDPLLEILNQAKKYVEAK
ncbi:hypothetical protein M115_1098 [Bacteroides fragilis str. 3719 T6]|nr:hypothetical protein M085_4271 [Bacteroides fragilis str. 3986 N(B)19]EYA49068.1 hypothetical protein M115_1098 [Bacteroides fragilis str. 3719 T6]